MNPVVRRMVAAAGAVIVPLALAATAAPAVHAETLVRHDTSRDVVHFVYDNPNPARTKADPDVVKVSIDHRQHWLLIRVKFREMHHRVGRGVSLFLFGSGGETVEAYAKVARKGRWQGYLSFSSEVGDSQCAGRRHRFDYQNDVSVWAIPTTCFGSTPWVRFSVVATVQNRRTGSWYEDDAFNPKPTDGNSSYLSRRIWRG